MAERDQIGIGGRARRMQDEGGALSGSGSSSGAGESDFPARSSVRPGEKSASMIGNPRLFRRRRARAADPRSLPQHQHCARTPGSERHRSTSVTVSLRINRHGRPAETGPPQRSRERPWALFDIATRDNGRRGRKPAARNRERDIVDLILQCVISQGGKIRADDRRLFRAQLRVAANCFA